MWKMLPCPYKRSWQWKLSRVHQLDYKNRAWGRIWGKVSLYTCNLLSDLAQPKHKSFRINVCQQSISMREFSYFSKNPLRGLLFRYSNLNNNINWCFWIVVSPFVIRSFIAVATFWRARQKLIEFVSRYLWKTRSTAEMSWVVKITFLVASSRTQFSMTWVNRGKWDSAR